MMQRAYCVRWNDEYWLIYAPSPARAKGAIIRAAPASYRPSFRSLGCRRWPAMDEAGGAALMPLGMPGTRDAETGAWIAMPAPWKEAA